MIPVIPVNNDDRLFGLLNQRGDRRLVYDLTETWPKMALKSPSSLYFILQQGARLFVDTSHKYLNIK